MEKPTLQEWKKRNPGKSINDYFREYPLAANDENLIISTADNLQRNQGTSVIQQPRKEPGNIASILVSIMIFIAFFLPWLDIKLLGIVKIVKSTGFELPNIIELVYKGMPSILLKSIYLIPICAFIAVVAETTKSGLRLIVQVVAILLIVYWFYLLKILITYSGAEMGIYLNPFKIFSFGAYITFLGCMFYIYDIMREIF